MRRFKAAFGWLPLLCAAVVLFTTPALAEVRREGAWPDAEKTVTLDLSGVSRAEALRKLAEAAGWSIVLHAPAADPLELHVKDQPATAVLDVILDDGSYVASRRGDLISVRVASEPAAEPSAVAPPPPPDDPPPPAASSAPEPPPASAAKGEDRVVTGGKLRIEPHEIVNDVVVFGGTLDMLGTSLGDVAVIGGSARVHKGAHVHGDAAVLGGALTIDDGARVDGDVEVLGGTLRRGEQAQIGGGSSSHGRVELSHGGHDHDEGWTFKKLAREVGGALTRNAMLFVLGAVLLALATQRMETLQVEIAARPMRSLALGVVGILGAGVLVVALCVTIVGVPVAVVLALMSVLAAYAGICAVLTTAGGALLRHRTQNPYLHLALGCVLLLVAGSLPFVGGFVTAAVVLAGFGAVVATRGAGLLPPSKNPNQGPYRTAA